ncbi:MAG: hypothetical protein ACREVS_04525 [Burkholderiales bacterium]
MSTEDDRRAIARRNRDTLRRFERARPYLEASRRVRETFARAELANVLHWSFALADEILGLSRGELDDFLYGVRGGVVAVDAAWQPAIHRWPSTTKALRDELGEAFAKIRAIAHTVASNEPTEPVAVTVELSVAGRVNDDEGRPAWRLRGRLADALVWMALKLFSGVPRSLIRPCGMAGCSTIYVAAKNQRYCPTHQIEAHRQTQRRAERAFRERQHKAKTKRGKR